MAPKYETFDADARNNSELANAEQQHYNATLQLEVLQARKDITSDDKKTQAASIEQQIAEADAKITVLRKRGATTEASTA